MVAQQDRAERRNAQGSRSKLAGPNPGSIEIHGMRLNRAMAICTVAVLAPLVAAQTFQRPDAYLLKGARVVVSPDRTLENADVLLMHGIIAEVGTALVAPPNVQVMDCSGLTVYPGLIHPLLRVSVAGLGPSQDDRTPEDAMERWKNLLSRRSIASVKSESAAIASLANNGYALIHAYSQGGLIGARSAVFSAASSRIDSAATVKTDLAVPLAFGGAGFGGYPSSTMGGIAFVRQTLLDGGRYGRLMRSFQANPSGFPRPGFDEDLEAVNSVVRGEMWAAFDDLNELSGLQALRIVEEFNLKPVLAFRRDAGYLKDLLKNVRGYTLIKDDLPSRPNLNADSGNLLSNLRAYFNEHQVAAELDAEGIEFLYAPGSPSSPLDGLRKMVRSGLSKSVALASITTRSARMLGVERMAGTVEKGKLGSVLVVRGDLLESSSEIIAVFQEGKRIVHRPPSDKQLESDPPLPMLPPDYRPFPRPAETEAAFRLFRNATIWTMDRQGTLKNADILIRNGKIVQVGTRLQAPAGSEIIDATGKHITPGVWDCHSHTAIAGGVNEGANRVTIECRIQDVINHRDVNIYRQLAGGTVGALQLHGSANPIGGQSATSKWRWGKRPQEFLVQGAPEGVKFALGENPCREDQPTAGRGQQTEAQQIVNLANERPRTRMGVEANYREAFDEAKNYIDEWDAYRAGRIKVEPRRNLRLEGIAELLKNQRWVHSHGYRQDEMLSLIRICQQYGVRLQTLQHVLEGFKIADEMAAAKVGGSTFADWWGYKLEAYDAIPYNLALMFERGVSVSVNSDSNEHARRLTHEAAKAIRYGGVSPEVALSFCTIEPVRQLGIDRITGSLVPGKDADLVVWSGDPLSIYTKAEQTYVDGVKLYDIHDDINQRYEREQYIELAREKFAEPEVLPTQEFFELGAVPAMPLVTGVAGNAKYPRKPLHIVGATVHPMTGDPFVGDVLVGSDGLITATGKVSAPRDAVRVDGKGKHVYPGMIESYSQIGLVEIPRIPVSVDSSERGDFNPDLRPERSINPDSEVIGVARVGGVLTAVTRPSGGTVPGQAALLSLDGYTWEDMTIQGGFAMVLEMGGGLGAGGGIADSRLQQLDGFLREAKAYQEAREAAASGQGPVIPFDRRLDALVQLASGQMPLLLAADSGAVIRRVVEWSERTGIPVTIVGGMGALSVADLLAAKQVPVILTPIFRLPFSNEAPHDDVESLPAQLVAKGVRIALCTNSEHNARQLRDIAGFAVRGGLDPEDGVRAVTLWPAQILGLGHRLGSIEPGKEGTLLLTDGDLLETRTQILKAWIMGRECDMTNRQTRLWDKYRTRPKQR